MLASLFGGAQRVALGMGEEFVTALREMDRLPVFKQVLNMAPKVVKHPPCQAVIMEGDEVDLSKLPIQTCWPGGVGPLITWGLVVTCGPTKLPPTKVGGLAHSVLMTKVINLAPPSARMRQNMNIKITV